MSIVICLYRLIGLIMLLYNPIGNNEQADEREHALIDKNNLSTSLPTSMHKKRSTRIITVTDANQMTLSGSSEGTYVCTEKTCCSILLVLCCLLYHGSICLCCAIHGIDNEAI